MPTTDASSAPRANQYSGTCPTCRARVAEGTGYIYRAAPSDRWQTYCPAHFPQRITPAAPVGRTLTVEAGAGVVRTPREPENLAILRGMPGARWDRDRNAWVVSLAPADRPRLLELADRLGLEVAPALRTDVRTAVEIALTERACARGLYPFQVDGVAYLARHDRALLADDMGLGKTVQVLIALDESRGTIVVCPASLKFNWRDETRRWRPDLRPVVLSGKGSFRIPAPGEVLILNYDVLPPAPKKGDDGKVPASPHAAAMAGVQLVVDEAHAVKSYKAQRSAAVKALARPAARVWALTGTPLPTRPSDLYGVLESTGMADLVFGTFGRFMKLFGAEKGRYGIEWGRPDPSVPEMLRRVMLRRRRTEVLPDLPRKRYSEVVVNGLSSGLRRDLDRIWDEQGDYLDVSDSLPPFEQFSALRARLAEERIPQMLEIVEQHEESETPLVVFSAHRAPVDALESRDGWSTITGDTPPERRSEIVREFQAGSLKGLGLTIAAGGVGLTLTHAWKELFVDLDWTPSMNAQAEDRICRIGQTAAACEIVRLVSDHPLDQHVARLIAAKIELVEGAIERELIATVPAPGTVPATEGETEEQYTERMARAAALVSETPAAGDVRRERALAKVEGILERETARAKAPVAAGPIGPALAEQIRGAIRYLSSVCDGAVQRDGQGFNQCDAGTGAVLAWTGLETEDSLRAAWHLARRYPKQVKREFPLLWA